MQFPSWVQKFKEPKTEIKQIKNGFYKYAIDYKYNPAKGRSDKITLHLLGKITEEDGFVPSEKQMLRQKIFQMPNVDIKTFGVYHLFTSLLSEDIESLLALFPSEIGQSLLTIAMMRFAHQSPLKRIPDYHALDFCSQYWVTKGLDDKIITAVLKYVGENRNTLVDWMRKRLGINNDNQENFVMIDSTHVPTLSEHLHINAKDYNPQHSYVPQVRLMYIFSAQMRQPVYYRLINGNITDVTSMKTCVDELNVKEVIFIADKGFYSKKNVADLRQNLMYFIIPLYRTNKLIDYKPLQEANFKKNIKNHFAYQNRIIWFYKYERNSQILTTYLDEELRVEEETDYLLRTKTHPDKYNEEGYYEKLHQFGTLTLISYLPKEHSAQELYEAYKQRNEIEIMFDAYKHFLEADITYMQNRYVLEGWLMANFIAMIVYYRLYKQLKEAKKLSKYSPKDIVELSKSIYQSKINDTWRCSPITEKTKDLFKKIKIDYLT